MPILPTSASAPSACRRVRACPPRSAGAVAGASRHALRAAFVAFVAFVAVPLVAPLLHAQRSETVRFTGRDVAVYNIVGALRVEGTDAREAEAVVRLAGADAGRLRLAHGAIRGRDALRVLYPDEPIRHPAPAGRARTMTVIRDDGTWGDGAVRGGRRVEVTSARGALDARADVTLRLPRGTRARVHLVAGTVEVANVDGDLLVDVASAPVSTRATRGALTLDTGSGDVTVRDARGTLRLDTGSGDVTIEDARGDVLNADTGSGALRLARIAFDSARFDTGSGDVNVREGTLGRVVADVGSGDVTLDLVRAPSRLFVDSGSGDVTLSLPARVDADLTVDTGSGDISTDFPIRVTRKSRRTLVGTLGDGGGAWMIDTGSGDVRLRRR